MSGGGTRAYTGVPDMRPIVVGGPSPRGEGIGSGIELLFRGINFVLQAVNASQQRSRLQQELNRLEPRVNRDLQRDPTRGVLLIFHFLCGPSHPESLIDPVCRYSYVTYGTGQTVSEARADAARHPMIVPAPPPGGSTRVMLYWFPPQRRVGPAALRRPFPVVATATFLPGRARLQDVKFGTLQGFDDEGVTTLPIPRGGVAHYRFDILRPPSSVVFRDGPVVGPMNIPVVTVSAGGGSQRIPVVDLDTTLGSVKAAMVFPLNDVTARAFWAAPATAMDPPGAIRGFVNFDRIRWVRPENIRVLQKS
ncbi:MAG: hypothetical protein GXP27_01555 [Planctomycetes bacterium]|nr:hypothetical protein [Planctomycetota bacterium]